MSSRVAGLFLLLLAAGCAQPTISDEMRAKIREHTRTDHEGIVVVRHPDGRLSANLRGRFRAVPVGVIDAQGKPRIVEGLEVPVE